MPTSFQAALEVQRCSQIFQIFPPLSADTQARRLPSVRSTSAGARLTSAECRNACHRRSKTLTISEFTSAQAQGVSAVRQTTQQLGHQGQRHRGGRRRAKEGLREKKSGREERSVAISFQTVLLKCAEMTQAFTYGVRTHL